MKTYSHVFHRENEDGTETEIEVEYEATPYDPGVSYGPAESCYPPEGGDVEIIKATLPDGSEADLADPIFETWTTWLMENPDQCAHGDDRYDDYD